MARASAVTRVASRSAAAVLVAGLLLSLVTACTGMGTDSGPAPVVPETYVGMTLLDARATLPDGPVLIYDLSQPLLGVDATYNDGKPQGQWTVLVDCTAENGHALGVIPTENANATLVSDALDGAYDHLLVECTEG